jgi:hypothetical protein
LEAFAQAFHGLYAEKGPDDPFDPAAVRSVVELAIDGLGPAARRLAESNSTLRPEAKPAEYIVCPASASCTVRSAVLMVFGHRDPFGIAANEIDDAYATLAGAVLGRCPSP